MFSLSVEVPKIVRLPSGTFLSFGGDTIFIPNVFSDIAFVDEFGASWAYASEAERTIRKVKSSNKLKNDFMKIYLI
jgi:hypothetical protein